MKYIKQKRDTVDRCNICGKKELLTWDHVPPKSSLFKPDVYTNTVFSDIPSEDKHMKHYQSGIKFRTICGGCNNDVLGKNDVEYKLFVNRIAEEWIKKANEIADRKQQPLIEVIIKINRVLRAICGHILASRLEYNDQVIPDINMREYVLDESLRLEKEKLFCWLYPYSTVQIARDFVVRGKKEQTHPKGMISVLASFPVAFIQSGEDESICGLDNLGKYSTKNIDEEIKISLHFSTLYYPNTLNLRKR